MTPKQNEPETSIINNVTEFLEARNLGEDSIEQVQRNTFKFTSCGAWLAEHENGISVGSIVEGCDQGTLTHDLTFPFQIDSFWEALGEVEKEADQIWNDTHGCEDCHPQGYVDEYGEGEFGNWPINPDCKECEGEGACI